METLAEKYKKLIESVHFKAGEFILQIIFTDKSGLFINVTKSFSSAKSTGKNAELFKDAVNSYEPMMNQIIFRFDDNSTINLIQDISDNLFKLEK
jgi:hypothetical protein